MTDSPFSPPAAALPSAPSRLRRFLSSWIIPLIILIAAAAPVAAMWLPDEVPDVQQRNLRTLIIVLAAPLLLLLWFSLFAPLPRRARLGAFASTSAAIILFMALFEIEGLTGDFAPIVRFRWLARPDRRLAKIEFPPTIEPGRPAAGKDKPTPSKTGGHAPGPAPAPATQVAPQNFPQFLGPRRNGVIEGVALARDWSKQPPKVLWRREIGAAWSGFAVIADSRDPAGIQGRAITQEQRGPDELVVCYDLATGNPLWQHNDEARYDTTIAGIGPRATPTIDVRAPQGKAAGNASTVNVAEGRVYTLGATGMLNCLDLEVGTLLWSVDLTDDAGAEVPQWGYAGSPLIEGDTVIVQTGATEGASLAAYDRLTGKRLWAVGDEAASYASPMIATLAGVRQIVMLNHLSCTGHDIATGKTLWRYEWRSSYPKAAQPVMIGGDRVVIAAGYGLGADAFEIVRGGPGDDAALAARPVWQSQHLKAKFANFVLRDAHLFGLNDGTLTCLAAETGQRTWRGQRYGHGQLLLVGDLLLLMAESGDVVLLEANAAEFRELSTFHVFDDKTWNSPALAGRHLLIRNDREAACLELPAP